MRTLTFLLGWLLALPLAGLGQKRVAPELIPNGGFEKYQNCPYQQNMLFELPPWFNPNRATPDGYNSTCRNEDMELPPRTGNGLGRLYFNERWAEYLASPLKEPLVAGECYYCEMYIAAPAPNLYLPNTIGAYFASDSLVSTGTNMFPVRPQILEGGSKLVTRRYQWEKLGNYFIAKGGERFMYIGTFSQLPTLLSSYYTFYDDISLKPVQVDLGPDTTLCGRSSKLLLDASTPGAREGLDYTWSDGSKGAKLEVSRPGTYWVTVNTPCKVLRDTIKVDYLLDFTLGRDTTLCTGQTLTLRVPPNEGTWNWQDGSKGEALVVRTPGSYFLRIKQGSCIAADTLVVKYTAQPQLNLGPDRSACGAETVLIRPDYADGTFRWDDGAPEERVVSHSGVYQATVQNACAMVRDAVRVDYGACGCIIYSPDAFTPNGDGVNDTFDPLACGDITIQSLEVYSRWGELIHRTQTPPFRWDGTYQGKGCPPNVYTWHIRYLLRQGDDQVPQTQQGAVNLLR